MSKHEILPTRLIHRLTAPVMSSDSPFIWGGGLRRGGLTREALQLLDMIFTFDYMGNSQFEDGEVPRALNAIGVAGSKSKLTTAEVTTVVEPDPWDRQGEGKAREVTFYIISSRHLLNTAKSVLRDLAGDENTGLIEPTYLKRAALAQSGAGDDSRNPIAWLELDNGFFIFLDKRAFEKTAKLFDVRTPTPAPKIEEKRIVSGITAVASPV